MSYRFLASVCALAVMLVAPLPGQTAGASAKPAAKAKSGSIPRTPDGHPDLEGVWTNATITPMERPAHLRESLPSRTPKRPRTKRAMPRNFKARMASPMVR